MSRGSPFVPVLAYHSMNISGVDYASCDNIALARDIVALHRAGFRIRPLSDVVRAVETDDFADLERCAAITMDDGSDFDFRTLSHPTWGPQRSMLDVLKEAAIASGRRVEATSFVIVSPAARTELDRKVMIGANWWTDDWWMAAEATGLLRVESHSWDHNHDSLERTVAGAARPGTFELRTVADADREICAANEYLCAVRARPAPVLFAYPYGKASEFLAREYFPAGVAAHGIRAAFTTGGAPVSAGADRWQLPRFVCGWHWKTEDDFQRLLDECRAPTHA